MHPPCFSPDPSVTFVLSSPRLSLCLQDEDDFQYPNDDLYNVQGSLREWVARDEVRKFVAFKFRSIIQHEDLTYKKAIEDMVLGMDPSS